jgi:hypothetical protein
MRTRDFGNFYWHELTYPYKPKGLWEPADTQEIDAPFRRGHGLAIRVPFTCKAIVIGHWKETGYSENQALTYAINGRGLKKDEVDWDFIRSMDLENELNVQKEERTKRENKA